MISVIFFQLSLQHGSGQQGIRLRATLTCSSLPPIGTGLT